MDIEVTDHGQISLLRLEGNIVNGRPTEILQSTFREMRASYRPFE
jgi:hypothetical protein